MINVCAFTGPLWKSHILQSVTAALLWPATLPAALQSDWQQKMQPIIPETYVCRRASGSLTIDGRLNEPAWRDAPWTEDFVDIQGKTKPSPRFRTRAKILWDDEYLYIAAELEEPDVWATLTNHDSVIFNDPDFEVFIDPRGQTQPYYEFEMNALNTTWDLRLNKPYMDEGRADDAWEISDARTAVQVRGTLNHASDRDQGWTVELAFPWKGLTRDARHTGPPKEGEQWRMNLSRVEWAITATNGAYRKVPRKPEDNWVWSPQGVVNMHRPEMWAIVQFTSRPAEEQIRVAAIPGKASRDLALEVYYAERDFWNAHKRWATNLDELRLETNRAPSQTEQPLLESTADGYACSVRFSDADGRHIWRVRQDRLLKLDEPLPVETELFIAEAAEKFGERGRLAAYFLVDNMPAADRAALSSDFLLENLSLAYRARKEFPWAANVPGALFLNDVLPYASLDEPRDAWRAEFYKMASEIVRGCTNATEAAQALNREIFKRLNVHYNLERKRSNQSPKESIEQHKATCTGLAIILVDACRAVGIPARIAGVPVWVQKNGNHTWAEIWDGDWFFTGADEYDKHGLNRGWFNGDVATTARSTNRLNQIYVSSWRRTGDYFPLAWDLDSRDVAAVNVSARYAALARDTNTAASVVHVPLRGLEPVSPRVRAAEAWFAKPPNDRGEPPDLSFTRDEAERIVSLAWADFGKSRAAAASAELEAKNLVLGDHSLKWLERTFGEAPDGRHSLWITLHGGGQATERENDLNWRGYFGSYEFPPGSINAAPRAPANSWNMWHVKWTDDLLDRLIADYVLQRGVDPDRVYLIGYSAGGDGVYQLSPRMSDRFAAAAMCAGHPNDVIPDGLRNLPFFLYVGGDDSAYNRNRVTGEFSSKMDALQKADPEGYVHRLTLYPGLPHFMLNRESEMIPRMRSLRRSGWPKRVVWKQGDMHTRSYWLSRAADAVKPNELLAAHTEGQTIIIETPASGSLTLRLSDALLDLDAPVRVVAGGKTVFEGKVQRSLSAVIQSLRERADPETAATALLPVSW